MQNKGKLPNSNSRSTFLVGSQKMRLFEASRKRSIKCQGKDFSSLSQSGCPSSKCFGTYKTFSVFTFYNSIEFIIKTCHAPKDEDYFSPFSQDASELLSRSTESKTVIALQVEMSFVLISKAVPWCFSMLHI
jgi:hypothetical protein